MTILPLARMGNPILRRVAAPIEDPAAPDVAQLAADMLETMRAENGVGLAAPQIGVSRRLIVFRVPAARASGRTDDEPVGETVLVNPEIEPIGTLVSPGWEGCLSIPDLRGMVPRFERIRYRGRTLTGDRIEREAAGFHARVVQHEVDHLDGILYLDRMHDLKFLTYDEEFHHFLEPAAEPEAPHDP